jgi:hypothetical protein
MPGMISRDPQAVNSTRDYAITLAGPEGAAIAHNSFSGAETLTALLRQGADGPTLATLTAVWDSSVAGNPATVDFPVVKLTVARAVLFGLVEPGYYAVQLRIDVGTNDVEAWSGFLRLTAAGGTTVAPYTLVGLADLARFAPWIEQLEDLDTAAALPGLATNFLAERGRATSDLIDTLLARYEDALDQQAERHGPVLRVAPLVPTDGYDGGPFWGDSGLPNTTKRNQVDAMRTLLATAGKLTVDDRLREIVARRAIALACENQLGNVPGAETSYQDYAAACRSRSNRLLFSWYARVDTDADGVADYEIR